MCLYIEIKRKVAFLIEDGREKIKLIYRAIRNRKNERRTLQHCANDMHTVTHCNPADVRRYDTL